MNGLAKTMGEATVKAAAGIIAASLLAILATFVTGTWSHVVSLWNLPTAVEKNRMAINALRIPTQFFEFSERSGPVMGRCLSGQNCAMILRVRRTSSALNCDLIPNSIAYFYRNPRSNETTFVDLVSGTPRDVGLEWVNLQFVFKTPWGLPPAAEFCAIASYIGCPGQEATGLPAEQSPECFDVPISDPPQLREN